MKTLDLTPPYFKYKLDDILVLTIWVGDEFVRSEIEVLDLEEALISIQNDGVNKFPENSSSYFTHYPPHKVDKIDIRIKNEKSQNK